MRIDKKYILILILFASCAGDQFVRKSGVRESFDEFRDVKVVECNIALQNNITGDYALGFRQTIDKKKIIKWDIYSYICTQNYYYAKEILFILDNERFKYMMYDNNRKTTESGYVTEFAFFKSNYDFIKKISQAEIVKIQIVGAHQSIDFTLGEEDKKVIKDFLDSI